jgi:hypothetical protein
MKSNLNCPQLNNKSLWDPTKSLQLKWIILESRTDVEREYHKEEKRKEIFIELTW